VKPTDLALSRALGLRDAPASEPHLLELPLAEVTRNHVGTMHAAAQFALAEAASAAALQREFPGLEARVLAVVRAARVKYRRPGTGPLHAFGWLDADERARVAADLAERSRVAATVRVELRDPAGGVAFAGEFDWFIARRADAP
jgi:acyl-coenzyme A thioesterase PaaI-like protein